MMSCNDLDRLGEKNLRIVDDFGGVGGFGLYGASRCLFLFSLSMLGMSNGVFVIGCNSPLATPRAVSMSRSLMSREKTRGRTLLCIQGSPLVMALVAHSTSPDTLSEDKTPVDV